MKIPFPKISIITAVKNGEKFLENTIKSIINQNDINFEYIIIDGGSNDSSLEIIKKYDKYISHWISGHDKNISDAFNTGLALASGDFINFQGDGDGFINENSLHDLFNNVDFENYELICGRVNRISNNGELIFTSPFIKNFKKKSLLKKLTLPHQGLFTHKRLFEIYGKFDINVKYGQDYEHLLRMYSNFPKLLFKNQIVSIWRNDGLGQNKEFEILKEYYYIKKKNKVAPKFILKLIYFWDLIKQIIKNLVR